MDWSEAEASDALERAHGVRKTITRTAPVVVAGALAGYVDHIWPLLVLGGVYVVVVLTAMTVVSVAVQRARRRLRESDAGPRLIEKAD